MNTTQSDLQTRVCRLCLTTSNCCIHMDGKWGEEMNLRSLINNLLPFRIAEHDGRSRYVCWNCCMHIKLLSMFIEKCVQKNEMLNGAVGSSRSQLSQSSCMSAAGSRGESFCEDVRRPDWLSLSFSSKGDSVLSYSATPTADLSTRPSKEELKKITIKRDCKRKKNSPHNKENRYKVARRHAKAGSSPDISSWKVGRLTRAARADDSTLGRYNLRKNTRASRHVTTPSTPETGKSLRQAAKTRRRSSLRNQSREPLLIFSQNAAQAEDEEDTHSGKTDSEFNFVLDADEIETPKKGSRLSPASQKLHSDDLLRRSLGPDTAEADVSSLLNCSHHQNPLQRSSKDLQNSGKRDVPNENFLGGKHYLGMQTQYRYDEDLSAQFARRHLSFVC